MTVFDGDCVSEANVGRQLYSPADVEHFKAVVTVHRPNQFYGLAWIGQPCRYEDSRRNSLLGASGNLIISCVDSRTARRAIHARLFDSHRSARFCLDPGNTEATARVVGGEAPVGKGQRTSPRLPCVTELFPELLDESAPDDNVASCSVPSYDCMHCFPMDSLRNMAC